MLLCAALLLSACGNDAAPESTSEDSVLDPGRELSITNNDGQPLEARAWGTGSRYVVLAHMRPADMTSWFDFARLLADEGFTAIAFNFRGYGESGGEPGEFSVAADVRAVVDAAVAEGASAVFVVGASMGGTGAVAASDAFFPFRDGPDLLVDAGVTAIIQPGGSKRDQEVIDACNERNIAMVMTGTRHFKH